MTGLGPKRKTLLASAGLGALAVLAPDLAHAVDGNWTGPGNEWTTGTNWSSTPVVPDGTATFTNNGAPTSVTISGATSIETIQFTAPAPAYSFAINLALFSIEGAGIVNNSAFAPSVANNGAVTFVNASSAGNAVIVNNGGGFLISFADNSTAANATITTNDGSLTQFTTNSTGGNARFVTNGGGIVDFSGTSGLSGNNQVTAGSIEGAGAYRLGANRLTVGGNNLSTTVSGTIEDGGGAGGSGASLVKVGAGTLTLTGANSYSGATTVNAGMLLVTGSTATSSLTTVNAGGTLGGTGTVSATTINGGTLAPGNSIGTITVQGNLTFSPSSTYQVEVSPTAADRTNVTGTASLGGGVQTIFAPGSYMVRQYTILHADGGRMGTFSGVSGAPPNFATSLSYTTTDVLLNLTAALGAGGGTSLPGNQQNVAGAINNFFNAGGALPPGFVTVFGLTGGALGSALSQLSGEAATGAQQGAFQLTNQFLGMMLDPFVAGRGGFGGSAGTPATPFAPERAPLPEDLALAYAKVTKAPATPTNFDRRWSVWGGGYGGANETRGDPAVTGSHDLSARAYGFAAGADYRVAPGTSLGFALAGGGTSWSLADGLGGGKSDAFQAGLYGATRSGPFYVAAALSYSWHDMSTDRFAFAGEHLLASFKAHSFGGRIEGGYRLATPLGGITPYGALQAQNFHTPAYIETGGGFALSYNARAATATRSELGSRFDRVVAVDREALVALRGRLAWAHDWVSDPTLTAAFQSLPGASFIVNGATPAKDLALASLGADIHLRNGVTLSGKFDGEFARNAQTYAGTGTVRYTW